MIGGGGRKSDGHRTKRGWDAHEGLQQYFGISVGMSS